MKQIQDEADVRKMLVDDCVVLFIFVDWSAYARHGNQIVKDAELEFVTKTSNDLVGWRFVDCTSTDSPQVVPIHSWLVEQDSKLNMGMFPNIALGHGSVVWVKNGTVLSFAPSAERLGIEELVRRTEQAFPKDAKPWE